MNKKNCVFGLVFAAMMAFGLMTMVGCKVEPEPEPPKVVAGFLRGTYTNGSVSFTLTENQMIYKPDSNHSSSWIAFAGAYTTESPEPHTENGMYELFVENLYTTGETYKVGKWTLYYEKIVLTGYLFSNKPGTEFTKK